MAKFSVKAFAHDGFLIERYDAPVTLDVHSKTFATLIETAGGGDQLVIHGKNLKYSEGELVTGTVTGLDFVDASGHVYGTMTGTNFKVTDLPDFTPQMYYLFGILKSDIVTGSIANDFLEGYNGSDVLSGLGGNDRLAGGKGNDRMTGGAGNDEFEASAYLGRDVITDFDAVGGDGAQDHIVTIDHNISLSKANHGRDTLVTFNTGDDTGTVLLLGVKMAQISVDDFMFV